MMNFLPKQIFLLDPIAIFFLAVIVLVSVPSAVFSIGYTRGDQLAKRCLSWVLTAIFVLSMCMVVVSGNIFSFLIFWELMSLVSYFLVVSDFKHEKSVRAGIIYLIMTHAGTACLVAAFLILYNRAGSFDYHAIGQISSALPPRMRDVVFLLVFTGFATKAGVVPLHIWLPYAHPQAPSHISSIMSGVMIKTAIYGMIRFFVTILAPAEAWWGGFIVVCGMISCLVGVIYALMDHDLKRLLAYHSVENIGIIMLGVGLSIFFARIGMLPAAALAMCGGLYHLINHALFKGLLFLCSGSIYSSTGLRDMEKMGGLIKSMPLTASCFLIGAMGISAIPPLNGFVSEWLMFQALFLGLVGSQAAFKIFIIIPVAALAMTSALAAACFVKAFGMTFLAMPRSKKAQEAADPCLTMNSGMAILAALVIAFGLMSALIAPIILNISESLLGTGGTAASLYLVSVLPAAIGVSLAVMIAAVMLWRRYVLGNRSVRYDTWDCGYYKLDSRNEYTATAFSKPFRIAFSFFLLPYRKSEKIRDSFYHVRKFTYETHTTSVFKDYFYQPIVRLVYSFACQMRRLQPGSIHLYILYIFFALAALIVFTTKF